MIDLMVENGVKLNDIGPKKNSVLSMPLTSVEIAKYFVSKGAKVTPNYEGREPVLHRMVRNSWNFSPNLELIKYLIEQGADLNQKDDFGETPYGRLLHLKRRAHRYIERYSHKNPKALKQHEIINLRDAKIFMADYFPGLEKLLKPNTYK
ncbi:MAG: hypothetical protein C0582_04300 [Alphaproteobacteria bacterium]|nr:MAG: hypothetical protein C0582_04300 [Alphaproteobacteria bacterium]